MERGRAGDVARVDRRAMGEKQLDQGGLARLCRMGERHRATAIARRELGALSEQAVGERLTALAGG